MPRWNRSAGPWSAERRCFVSMRPAMRGSRGSSLHAHTYGRASLPRSRDGCGLACRATGPNGGAWLLHSGVDYRTLAGNREQTFDVEMIFDVIGERFERALDPGAVRLVSGRNFDLCEKCSPEAVRRKQAVQV